MRFRGIGAGLKRGDTILYTIFSSLDRFRRTVCLRTDLRGFRCVQISYFGVSSTRCRGLRSSAVHCCAFLRVIRFCTSHHTKRQQSSAIRCKLPFHVPTFRQSGPIVSMCQLPDRPEESCVMTEVHFEQVRDAETEVTQNPVFLEPESSRDLLPLRRAGSRVPAG